MQSVSLETAKTLVSSSAVTQAVIQCFDGRRWAIVLRGPNNVDYVLKSARQSPRPFARLETALGEVQELGLHHAAVDFVKWHRDQEVPATEAA